MDKELIEHIATKLQNHEEPYSPGAWERFTQEENKKRKGFVYWPLWSAAAIILIFGGIFFGLNKKNIENKAVKNQPKIENKKGHSESSDIIPESKNTDGLVSLPNQLNLGDKPEVNNQNLQAKNDIKQKNYIQIKPSSKSSNGFIESNILLTNHLAHINISPLSAQNFEVVIPKKQAEPTKKITFEELLAQDSKADQYKSSNKVIEDSKWEPSVYVAPAMGNDSKVNINYGFSLSYAVANKLSISSGVSYASLSSSESLNTSAPKTLSGKNLASVNAKVKGINIPLELKYKISDKLYTGIGISALAVLDNSQNNTYLVNQVQSVVALNDAGISSAKNYIVKEKTSEPQPEESIDPDKYIGFYNFSLGYKQKISKKNNISVEPFLRVPMKTFSKDNLNLTNGGLRLKIDF